jgi:hypothetical protein
MIKYLGHNQIDKNQWDDCISRSQNRRVYAFSWYLDTVCPGWDALVLDNYAAVFPLTHHHKWSVSYLFQPYFAQQLGIFSPGPISENLVSDFIRAIPAKFRFIEIHLNSGNNFPGLAKETLQRSNYELNLQPGYEQLTAQYAQNTRRNIKKASEAGMVLSHTVAVDELIGLFRHNFGKKEGKLKDRHYNALHGLITWCRDQHMGYILGSKTNNGVLSAGAFFLFDKSHVYFLFAASSLQARENGAMFFLIDHFIREHAGNELLLDFEGGNDPNLGRFYKSFGAVDVPYPALSVTRLSKFAMQGLYFMRKFR